MLDWVLDIVDLYFRHNRADLAVFNIRRSYFCFLGDGECSFNGFALDRAFHQYPVWRVAGLARVVEAALHEASDSYIEVMRIDIDGAR